MNAESIAILQVMICETKHEIQGGGNHPPLVADVTKKLGSPRVKLLLNCAFQLALKLVVGLSGLSRNDLIVPSFRTTTRARRDFSIAAPRIMEYSSAICACH